MDFAAFLDDLTARAAAALEGEGVLRPWAANLMMLRRITSTNDLGRRIVDEYAREGLALPPAVLVAWEQSAGRGRHGATWVSPPGQGVYLTLLRPVTDPSVLPTLPLLAPVALARAVDAHLGEGRCRIKWPNDLLVDGRKIAGVLLAGVAGRVREGASGEERTPGGVVLGVGVNHGQSAAELEGVAPRGATSLAVELGREDRDPPPLTDFVWEVLRILVEELEHAGDGPEAVRRYQQRSLHEAGERLRCKTADGILDGSFRGFDDRGFLRLELAAASGGRRAGEQVLVTAGEVVSP